MFNMTRDTMQQIKGKYERIHINSPVGVNLPDLMENPPMGAVKLRITPDLAARMLEYNTSNRPASKRALSAYSKQMSDGDWVYTGVPIIFSDRKRLIDGQHRLMAVVSSGVTIEADVAFGKPNSAFAFIDMGKKRTAGDIFSINGVRDQNRVAATAKIVWLYASRGSFRSKGIEISPSKLYDFFSENPDINLSKDIYSKFKKARLAMPSLMAGLYVICARKNKSQADEFFSIAADGFGAEKKSDPAFVLHRKFVEAATSGVRLGGPAEYALTVEAWNRMRTNLSGRGLKYNPEAKMPRVR